MLGFTLMETFPTINKFPQDNLLVGIVPLNIAFPHIELFIKSIFDIKQKAFILANKHLADNFIVLKYIGGCRLTFSMQRMYDQSLALLSGNSHKKILYLISSYFKLT